MAEPVRESGKMKKPVRIVTVLILVVVVIIGVLLYELMFSGGKKSLDRTSPISHILEEETDQGEESSEEEDISEPQEEDLQERIALRKSAPDP